MATVERSVVVGDPRGMHFLPSGTVAQLGQHFGCSILLGWDRDRLVNVWDAMLANGGIIRLVTMGFVHGSRLVLRVEGDRADECIELAALAIEAPSIGVLRDQFRAHRFTPQHSYGSARFRRCPMPSEPSAMRDTRRSSSASQR